MSAITVTLRGASGRLGQHILAQLAGNNSFKLHAALVSTNSLLQAQALPLGLNGCYQSSSENPPPGSLLIDVSHAHDTAVVAQYCHEHQLRLLSGVTGLDAAAQSAIEQLSTQQAVLHTANFSVGATVLAHLLKHASASLGPEFQLGILDLHHQHKKDAPSGTALLLEQAAGQAMQPVQHAHFRLSELVGEHRAFLVSPFERLELSHSAPNRGVFAAGALRAASWLAQQPRGRYQMQDVLGLTN
jgi:4-hydroxy-tetrahydrodipicolinate reductase